MYQQRPTEDEIFRIAYEIPSPDARITYLKQVCRDSVELERIIDLLKEGSPDESFLEKGPAGLVETTDVPVAMDMSGESIGPYKLLQPIGEGGFGVVYMAEQVSPVRRKVALKVIKPGMDTKQVVARFEAERQALALMDHPNVARVFDGGTTEAGRPYFVMELVKGVPITTFCDENKLDVHQRLELFCTVCKAIQHAHQKGVIHRDIKPSNVLVTLHDGKPVPKVIDFGVAKAMSQQLTEKTMFTAHGQMIGTVQYMSPEQAEMSGLDIDTRSDIYSLGILLYELLTGDTPLDLQRIQQTALAEMHRLIRDQDAPKPSNRVSTLGDQLSIVAEQRSMDPRRLGRFLRGDLDWIVMKAIEKDRNRRYETASSFAIDVERFLQSEPVEACPPSLAYKASKFVRRNRGPVLAGSLIALSLVLGFVGTTTGWLQARRDANNARESEAKERDAKILAVKAEERQRTARARAEKAEQDLQQQSYFQLVRLADQAIGDGRPSAARRLLEKCHPDNLAWEWHYLNQLLARKRLKSPECEFPDDIRNAAWSPDDPNRAVAITGNGSLYELTLTEDTIQPRLIITLDYFDVGFWGSYDIAYSAKGDEVSLITANGLLVIELENGAVVTRIKAPQHRFLHMSFHPNQRWLVTTRADMKIIFWDKETGQKISGSETGIENVNEVKGTDIAFSPDGNWLAVSSISTVFVWSVRDGKLRHVLESHFGPAHAVAFSSDSKRLATAATDARIVIHDVKSGDTLKELKGHTTDISGLSFASNRLASSDRDGVLRIWDVDLEQEVLSTKRQTNFVVSSFSQDGNRLVLTEGANRLMVWDATEGAPHTSPIHSFDNGCRVFEIAFLSDGRRVASVGEGADNAGLKFWDLDSGQRHRIESVMASAIALDPNGKRIATAHRDGVHWCDQRSGIFSESPECLRRVAWSVVISPDGRWLAAGFHGPTFTTSMWDLRGEIDAQTEIRLSDPGGHQLEFSPQGRYLCGSGGNRLVLWDVAEFAERPQIRVIARTSGSAAGSSHTAGLLWNVAFSPDEEYVVFGDGDGFIKTVPTDPDAEMVPAKNGEELPRAATWTKASNSYVNCVVFSPDGRYLASAGADETIRIWDWKSKQLVASFLDEDPIFCLAFNQDGRMLASGGHGKKIKVWDTSFLMDNAR